METKQKTEEVIYTFLQKHAGKNISEMELETGLFKLTIHKALKKLTESKRVSFNEENKTYSVIVASEATKNGKASKKPVVDVNGKDEATLSKTALSKAGRDTTKYVFNKQVLAKSRVFLEVVRQYVKLHPSISLQMLQTVFKSKELYKRYGGAIVELNEARKYAKSSGRERNFLKPQDILIVNSRKVVCTNQVDVAFINAFITIASSLKIKITKQP